MQLNDAASILLYLVVFLTAGIFAYLGEKKKCKTFYILAILLPVLLASFRFTTGTDSLTYRTLYDEIGNESSSFTSYRVSSGELEPFVVYASVLGNALHLPASFLFFLFASITAVALFFTTRIVSQKHAWLIYGMLLFIVFPEGMNVMRQVAANSVQALALAYVFNEHQNGRRIRITPTLLLVAFSITLHYSSVLLLPVFFLPTIIKHVRGYTLALLLSLLIALCVLAFPALLEFVIDLGIISQRHYATFMEIEGSLINVKFFAALIAAAALIANYNRRKKLIDKQYSLLMLLGVSYAAVGFYSGYLGRLAIFFWIFIIMFAGKLLCQLFTKESHRIAICSAVAIMYFIVYFYLLEFNALIPYSFGA